MGCCQDSLHNSLEIPPIDSLKESHTYDKIAKIKDEAIHKFTDVVFPILQKVFVHSTNGVIDETYKLHEIIGQGSYSTVRRAVHIESGLERAAKSIAKNSLTKAQKLMLVDEIETLKSLDHPNIIRVIEIIEDSSKLNIVTELCTGGELFDRIVSSQPFTENTAASFMYQILSGLIHIHSSGFIHRDLKPENIMLFSKQKDTPLKIIDFGVSKRISAESMISRFIGTVHSK